MIEQSCSFDILLRQSVGILLSGAGFFAVFYSFAYLAIKARLNMLGVWANLDINPLWYVSDILVAVPVTAFSSIIVLLLTGAITFLLFQVLRRFGYSFSWSGSNSLPVLHCSLMIVYFSFALYLPFCLIKNLDLLLQQNTVTLNAYVSLIVDAEKYTLLRYLFFTIQFLSTLLLFFLLRRLWLSRQPGFQQLRHSPFGLVFGSMFLISIWLLPIIYGLLILPHSNRRATLFLREGTFRDTQKLEGFPIIQTSQELVFFTTGSQDDSSQRRIHVFPREVIGRLEFSQKPEGMAESSVWNQIYRREDMKGLYKSCGQSMGWIIPVLMFGLAFCTTLTFAERNHTNRPDQKQSRQREEEALTKGQTTGNEQGQAVFHPQHPGKNEESAKGIQFLSRFYPFLKQYADRVAGILDDMVRISSSRGREEDIPDQDLSQLNIWCFNLKTGDFKQITHSGGYFCPRASADGGRISFIKNGKIGIMDISGQNERIINSQLKYKHILSWNSEQAEYLTITDADQLYWLKAGEKSEEPLKEIPAVSDSSIPDLNLDVLSILAQTSPGLKQVYARSTRKGTWRILENHSCSREARILFEDAYVNLAPSWMRDEEMVIFVSNRSRE